jgi:hypothetical protein
LARVDGKSPAEYITAATDKELIRRIAYQMLSDNLTDYSQVVELAWQSIQAST